MTHRAHPVRTMGYDDPDDAILWDDCRRCATLAEDFNGLDIYTLGDLWRRMTAVQDGEDSYRTRTESRAGWALWRAAVLFEKLTGNSWRTLMKASAV